MPREDTIKTYLNEIGRIPLLTPQEERSLADRIAAGREAKHQLDTHDALTPERRRTYQAILANAEEARASLVQANLRLVVHNAKRYSTKHLDLLDLIQEGNKGLVRATETFDATRGYRFSTYATHWIRQSIGMAVRTKDRTIRLPDNVQHDLERLRRTHDELNTRSSDAVSEEDLARHTPGDWTPRQVRTLLQRGELPLSLDYPHLNEEGDLSYFVGSLRDTMDVGPLDATIATFDRDQIKDAIHRLPPQQAAIVRLRFGLNGEVHTLQEVSVMFGLSRERIRQIEKLAVERLRDDTRLEAAFSTPTDPT